jgi:23S rRNA pseudouridine1911/1915/1917 synthase
MVALVAAEQHDSEHDHQALETTHGSGPPLAAMTSDETRRLPGTAAGLQQVTVGLPDAGERLDRMLASHLGSLSRTRLKHLILEGNITRDGATISDPSTRVKPGDTFTVAVPPPVADRPVAQTIPLDIRYEDDHLLVVDKPAGLVVHPAPGNLDHTLVNALLAHCGDSLAGIGGVKRPGIVHRLDKDTSGLMVVAKSEPAHVALSAALAARRVKRLYRAVVWGVPLPRSGDIVGNIGRSPRNRKKMAVVAHGGKPAMTHYQVLREYHGIAALIDCRLATGRTHQIRVHLTERGHPLIGDPVYGSARARRNPALDDATRAALAGFGRQALHARLLGFDHPITGEAIEFTSELPNDMVQLINSLEKL